MNMRLMLEMLQAFRNDAPLGDVALMKFVAMSKAPEGLDGKLKNVRGYAPQLETEALVAMPDGTLGREYARFLTRNKLDHLKISPAMLTRFQNNPFAVRYTVTHDFYHLLTGFDTGIAGEIGVAAFMTGQGTGLIRERKLRAMGWFLPLVFWGQGQGIKHNIDLGLRMGKEASMILTEPFESMLEEPLLALRERLGICAEDIAKVQPSKPSTYAQTLYKLFGRELEAPSTEPM